MRTVILLTLTVGVLALASCGENPSSTSKGGTGSGGGEPTTAAKTGKPERNAAAIAAGKEIFKAQCEKCHGPEGKGDGASKGVALPQPTDFTKKLFKYVSAADGKPTEADLYRTVTDGVAGTQMQGFKDSVGESDRWSVVYFVQDLAKLDPATKAMAIPPRGTADEATIKAGKRVYLSNCVKCHGTEGKADGVAADTLKDAAGNPLKPRNLVDDPFGGGMDPNQVFCRIFIGMTGTPMAPPESYAKLSEKDAWAVTEYVLNLRKK